MNTRSQSARNSTNRHIACLIRLWQDGAGRPWRASVQAVASSEIICFASLEMLFDYLNAQTNQDEVDPQDGACVPPLPTEE